MGTCVGRSKLLNFTLTTRMEISIKYGEDYLYTYLNTNGQRVPIRLPCTDLFDRSTGKWKVEEVPPQEEPQAPEVQGFQPQEMPPYPGMQGYPYGYYPGSGSGGYGHYPGY